MHYHTHLGVGHVYCVQRQTSTGYSTEGKDAEVEPVLKCPDENEEDPSLEVESSSEHSSDFSGGEDDGEGDEVIMDEEFLLDEDMYGY